MNFDLDDNQTMFKASVERFAGVFDIVERHRARASDVGFDRRRWSELAELGLIALAAPEDNGGLGGSPVDLAVVAEALGKGLAIEPWLECGFLSARLLADTPWLEAVLSGSSLAAFAFAETHSRYALDARAVIARQDGDGFTLSGEKQFVLGGAAADLFVVTAKLGEETALFAISKDASGLVARPYAVVDGSKAAVLALHNVKADRLPVSFDELSAIIAQARLLASAEMLGLASRLFDETLEYVKTREQFGQPLGRFQTIQHRMVENYSALEQMRSALWRAAMEDGADWQRNMAGSKAFIGENALRIGHEAMQVHGGMGMTDELLVGHAHKRILLLSKLFGDPASDLAEYAKAA